MSCWNVSPHHPEKDVYPILLLAQLNPNTGALTSQKDSGTTSKLKLLVQLPIELAKRCGQ